MGRTKPTVSADYVVGITDGEGCFYVNMGKSSAYKVGWRIQLHFHLKLQVKDEKLLWRIRHTLGCGNVYFQHETRSNHAQCYRYTVGSWKDINEKIIPFFKNHTLQTTSKQKSFMVFCKIAELVKAKKHLTPKGIEEIRILKSRMNQRTVGLA